MSDRSGGWVLSSWPGQPTRNVNYKNRTNSNTGGGVRWGSVSVCLYSNWHYIKACYWFGDHPSIKVVLACQTDNSQINCFDSRPSNWRLLSCEPCFPLRLTIQSLPALAAKVACSLVGENWKFWSDSAILYKNSRIDEAVSLSVKYSSSHLELI